MNQFLLTQKSDGTQNRPSNELPVTVIEASTGYTTTIFYELWEYRELLYFLTWRDLKVRYKQTVLGVAWAVIQPICTTLVFSLFFGKLAGVPSDGVPYPIFTYTALLPWSFFANGLNLASNSLVNNTNLVTKVYFPRLVIPLSSILAGLLDFAIAFIFLLGMMFFYSIQPTIALIWLPLFLLLAFVTTFGISLWLSALNVQYRDIRYALPFLAQLWLFLTPIAYPSSLLEEPWRSLYGLNPMVGVVEGFRWALLGTQPSEVMMGLSVIVSVLLLVSGVTYFQRMEELFADVI